MSDSNEAEGAVLGPEEQVGGAPRGRATGTCCFCGKAVARDADILRRIRGFFGLEA